MAGAGLLGRLEQGHVICAEGYLFELERRGYIQAGAFVPEAVLDHPEKVTELHREFVHAGSDVVEAFTYYAHREKMRVVGKEGLLEELNRNALALAKEVADETDTLFAGDICNTNVFDPDDPESKKAVQAMFDEQVAWAAEAGVDFIIAETYSYAEEARMALETIKAAGLPAVITMCIHQEPVTRDGMTPADACAMLEQAGTQLPVLPPPAGGFPLHTDRIYNWPQYEHRRLPPSRPHRDASAAPPHLRFPPHARRNRPAYRRTGNTLPSWEPADLHRQLRPKLGF